MACIITQIQFPEDRDNFMKTQYQQENVVEDIEADAI